LIFPISLHDNLKINGRHPVLKTESLSLKIIFFITLLYQSYKKGYRSYLKLERGLSSNTLDAYLHDVDLLFRFLEESDKPDNFKTVKLQDLRRFILFINEMKLGSYSQARIISGIKSFFNYLVLENVILSNPAELLESPRLGRKLPEVLTPDEVTLIIDSVDLSKPEGERDKAILEVLYGCGVRVSELTGLRLSDLHFKEGLIVVTGKGDKQRLVPIGSLAQKQVNIYRHQIRIRLRPAKNAEDILFLNRRGGRLSRQMVFLVVKRQVEKAGIRKKVSPHTFRHSFATHLVQNGADLRAVQQLLGHVSITTTEIYTHLNQEDLRRAILKYHPRNR